MQQRASAVQSLRAEVVMVREPVSAEFFGLQEQLVGVDITFFHRVLLTRIGLVVIEPE
jgi:hypothetical protein